MCADRSVCPFVHSFVCVCVCAVCRFDSLQGMEQAASVAAAAATAVVAVGADKDARNSTTKRKSSFGTSESSPGAAAVKRPTKITDFWYVRSMSLIEVCLSVSGCHCVSVSESDACIGERFRRKRECPGIAEFVFLVREDESARRFLFTEHRDSLLEWARCVPCSQLCSSVRRTTFPSE